MKLKKFVLVGIFLLAIITLNCVCAADNLTESPLSDDYEFVQYEDGSGTVNPNMQVEWPDEMLVGDYPLINYTLPKDISVNSALVLYVNDHRIDDGKMAIYDLPYWLYVDDFGTYNLKLKFTGDDKYAPAESVKTYVVKDYLFNVDVPDTVVYGKNATVAIELPFDCEGFVKINNEKYELDGLSSLDIPLNNLKLGTNAINITYSGDSKYKSQSKVFNVNVIAGLIYDEKAVFDDVTFSLSLPGEVNGKLQVCVDGNIIRTSHFTNNVAEIRFDGLAFGNHSVTAKYLGNDHVFDMGADKQFEVIPKITVNSFKTPLEDNTVEITIPETDVGTLNVTLKQFEVDVGGVIETFKTTNVVLHSLISFSKLDYGYYQYDITYASDSGYVYSTSVNGLVKYCFDMNITYPEVVFGDSNISISVDYLDVDDGELSIYVDGVLVDTIDIDDTGIADFNLDSLSFSDHVVDIVFSGNNNYALMMESFLILSTYYLLNIPDEIIMGIADDISITTLKDATGQLVIYIDGKEFARQNIINGFASISLAKLSFNTYDVRVAYENGNYQSFSKDMKLNVSYSFAMDDQTFQYGANSTYSFEIPEGLDTSKLVIKLDNVTQKFTVINGKVNVDVSGLDVGIYEITATHPGDDLFYPMSVKKTIKIAGRASIPQTINLGNDEFISMILPDDPEGKMVIYEFDEFNMHYAAIANVEFEKFDNNKSIAKYSLSRLGLGIHDIKVSYSGDDFDVSDAYQLVEVDLDVHYDALMQYGKAVTIMVNLKNADGLVDVYIDYDLADSVKFVDGAAKIQLEDVDVGLHTFSLEYEGDPQFEYEGIFMVYPSITIPTSVIDGGSSITVNSGDDPVGTVIVYVDGKKLKEVDLDGGKQTISLSSVAAGSHTIEVLYDSWEGLTFKKQAKATVKKASITAKDMSMFYLDGSKFKVQIKDYKGKAVGKNQQVKFYIDGKLFKTVKTDSKGYASIVLTNTPKTYSVKVTYKASSVTKKVTVKQVLTLSKVAPKKSAKSLVLTATLKKVNGKYLKNKWIVFKFNGVTFKAKTNSKGVAKVTVPKSTLSKLKVGKTITYQATYSKATVKLSAKVNK